MHENANSATPGAEDRLRYPWGQAVPYQPCWRRAKPPRASVAKEQSCARARWMAISGATSRALCVARYGRGTTSRGAFRCQRTAARRKRRPPTRRSPRLQPTTRAHEHVRPPDECELRRRSEATQPQTQRQLLRRPHSTVGKCFSGRKTPYVSSLPSAAAVQTRLSSLPARIFRSLQALPRLLSKLARSQRRLSNVPWR